MDPSKAITKFLRDLVKMIIPEQPAEVDDRNFAFAARVLASQVPGSMRGASHGHPVKDDFRIKHSMFRFVQQKINSKEMASSSSRHRDRSNRLSELLQRIEANPVLTRPWYMTAECLKHYSKFTSIPRVYSM